MDKKSIDTILTKNPFRPLNDIIYEIILDEILKLKLLPGDKLVESKIAENLNTSRTTVNKALKRLSEDGLITDLKGRSSYISELDSKDYYNVCYTRSGLETSSASLAAIRITDDELKNLCQLLNNIHNMYNKRDFYGILKADFDFHNYIVQCSHNKYSIKAYEQIKVAIQRYMIFFVKDSFFNDSYKNEHVVIYNSIRNKDSSIAGATMKAHLKRTFLIGEDTFSKRYYSTIENMKNNINP